MSCPKKALRLTKVFFMNIKTSQQIKNSRTIIQHWLCAVRGAADIKSVEDELKSSDYAPNLLSIVFTRRCVFQCRHCFYPPEAFEGNINAIQGCLKKILKRPKIKIDALLHAGRIFLPAHLKALQFAKGKGLKIGMIDNGNYVASIDKIKEAGVRFDWMDISVDGTKRIHNLQRANPAAYTTAYNGIKRSSEVAEQVNVLLTASKINYKNIPSAIEAMRDDKNLKINRFIVGLVNAPDARPAGDIKKLEINSAEFGILLNKLKRLGVPVSLSFYRATDFLKFLDSERISEYGIEFDNIQITYRHKKFPIAVGYTPESLAVAEEFIIDSNGEYVLPYSGQFKVTEMPKKYKSGSDLSRIPIEKAYKKAIDRYFQVLGYKKLKNEIKLLRGREF